LPVRFHSALVIVSDNWVTNPEKWTPNIGPPVKVELLRDSEEEQTDEQEDKATA